MSETKTKKAKPKSKATLPPQNNRDLDALIWGAAAIAQAANLKDRRN